MEHHFIVTAFKNNKILANPKILANDSDKAVKLFSEKYPEIASRATNIVALPI